MLTPSTLSINSLSEECKKVIHISQQFAFENLNNEISPAHILKALLHKDIPTRKFINSINKDVFYLEEWADIRMESKPKTTRPIKETELDNQVISLLQESDLIRLELNKEEIDSFCLLIGLCIPGLAFSYDQLKTFPLSKDELVQFLKNPKANNTTTTPLPTKNTKKSDGTLQKYCLNKNEQALEGKINEAIGREKELRMTLEVLSRKSKPNVIIIGEPGVGKTSLVEGLALQFANGKVPSNLANAKIFELNLGTLLAGASYKGEAEDRFIKIIQELKSFEKPILFIDEIHSLLDKNKGLTGIINLLKPELTKGELTIIGTSTTEDYRKFLESDETFSRRFEIVTLLEPDATTAFNMIKSVVYHYEDHHQLKIQDDAIEEAIRLSKRFNKQRRLPDSAIDLIDRTMAGLRMMADTTPKDLAELSLLTKDVENILNEEQDSVAKELIWLHKESYNKISYLLLNKLKEYKDISLFNTNKEVFTYIEEVIKEIEAIQTKGITEVDKGDLAAVISDKTGIPIGKLQSQERERLLSMEDHLRKRVVGQDQAISSITEAILESRSGLNKGNQPIGSFFLLGPTGTGKTELAKSLCDFLFQDETAMIRFDMSEFKEEHSVALLYGAPPGYVGYEEGGLLVNKIRSQPYSVVLFDEIEKAHPSVFDLFLQIMDEGKLHDRLGKEGDFSNAVILFTSNIGSEIIADSCSKGEILKTNELMEIMSRYFRPEFLARLTEIVPFSPISEKVVLNIFKIHLKELLDAIEKKGINFEITEEASIYLSNLGFTPKYGARPLKGVIRDKIRRPLSRMIISEKVKKGDKIILSIDSNNNLEWKIN